MPGRLRLIGAGSLACMVWLGACEARFGDRDADSVDWAYFGGDKAFTRYAPLDQITRDNVGDLEIVWRRPAVDSALTASFPDLGVSGYLRATPILHRRRAPCSQRGRSGGGLRSGDRRDPLDPAALPADDRGGPRSVVTGDGLLD